MKKKVLAAIILAMGILAGCGSSGNEESQSQVITPLPSETQEASSSAAEKESTVESTVESEEVDPEDLIITEREVVDGKMQSYLTGEWKDEAVVDRRNMAVMIPNNKSALPQYGISQASIIYEAPVEGRITRLMCLFEDYDELDKIITQKRKEDVSHGYHYRGFETVVEKLKKRKR